MINRSAVIYVVPVELGYAINNVGHMNMLMMGNNKVTIITKNAGIKLSKMSSNQKI